MMKDENNLATCTIVDEKDFSSFENVQNKIIDKQNHKLLNKIFNNFDWKLN